MPQLEWRQWRQKIKQINFINIFNTIQALFKNCFLLSLTVAWALQCLSFRCCLQSNSFVDDTLKIITSRALKQKPKWSECLFHQRSSSLDYAKANQRNSVSGVAWMLQKLIEIFTRKKRREIKFSNHKWVFCAIRQYLTLNLFKVINFAQLIWCWFENDFECLKPVIIITSASGFEYLFAWMWMQVKLRNSSMNANLFCYEIYCRNKL